MPIGNAALTAATLDHKNRDKDGEHFETAIARYQLDVQTQLKRSTSLPSAMFDAADPMLEARLCEATEGIFQQLLEYDVANQGGAAGEQRLETVSRDELARTLQAAVAGDFADAEVPSLTEHAQEEFLALLAEAVARSTGAPQQHAAKLLWAQGHGAEQEMELLMHAFAERLGHVDETGDASPDDEARLGELCQRVAAAVVRATAVRRATNAAEEDMS